MARHKIMVFSSFILKIIAIVAVLSDHIAYAFIDGGSPLYSFMRIIGRLAFVLFAFFVSEGVFYSRNKDKYLLRLLLMVLILQILTTTAYLFDQSFAFANIFITLAGGASLLIYLEKKAWHKVYYLIPFAYALTLSILANVTRRSELMLLSGDYGTYGLIVIISFYLFRKLASLLSTKYPPTSADGLPFEEISLHRENQFIQNAGASLSILFVTFIYYVLSIYGYDPVSFNLQSYALLVIPFLFLYNGKIGHNSKGWRIFYYAFFPAHFIILALFVVLQIFI